MVEMEILARGAIPAAELVEGRPGGTVACATIESLALHPSGQPVLTDPSEPERARLLVECGGQVALRDPDGSFTGARIGPAAGVVVFTDRRIVGAFGRGDFLDIELNRAEDGRALCLSLAYDSLESLDLIRETKLFGDLKDFGLRLQVASPARAGLQMQVFGGTTLAAAERSAVDLAAIFEALVIAICDVKAGAADDAGRAHLTAVRGGERRYDDLTVEAVFEPAGYRAQMSPPPTLPSRSPDPPIGPEVDVPAADAPDDLSPSARRLLRIIRESGPIAMDDLPAATGMAPLAAATAVRELHRCELVAVTADSVRVVGDPEPQRRASSEIEPISLEHFRSP